MLAVALTALAIATHGAGAQPAQERAAAEGVANGMKSPAGYYSCQGLIPVYSAVTSAIELFGSINQMGEVGERIVRNGLGGIPKNTTSYNGRIPDYVTPKSWVEVKNTKALSYTHQLRQTVNLAKANGKTYTIITRINTKLSRHLMRAMANGTLKIIKCLPPILGG
jgi:hypothetical protein